VSQLILWNDTLYSQNLSKFFGRENVITGKDDFIEACVDWNKYSSIIVLCELKWSLKESSVCMQHFQGIELVKELRRTQNLIIPVLFVSIQALEDIFNAEREILTAIGHDFYQLPAVPQELKTFITKEFGENGSIRKLSEMELNDIKSFYCSKEGILSHELHYLNHYLNFNITPENYDSTYADLQDSIRKIHDLFIVDSTAALVSFQVGYSSLSKDNINEAVSYIIRMGNDLLKNYSEKTNGIATKDKITKQYRWKVLLLDDQINEHHELVQLMKSNHINVICVDNAPEAIRALTEDWNTENSIMVVIADYRLYLKTEGVKRLQKIQGYQFLKDIASTDHLVRLVAFSGLQRKFLLNSFKHYNIRTEVKSKTDYLSSEQTQQFFCDEIIELAEENLEAIEALPSKCAGFEKTLKDAYKEFRMHPDYNKMEGTVSWTAKEYIWEIQQQLNDRVEIRIGAIDNIKSPLAKTRKDQEAFFKRFQNYLVARRIALWLYASNKKSPSINVDSRKIAEILTDQKYPTDAYRQILSTNLGLSLDDFPKNITIEERRWLQYEMQLNIFRDISYINPIFNKVEHIYKDFIASDEAFKGNINKSKYALPHKYKQANYLINFAKDLTPEIKTATDARVLFLLIAQHIKKDKRKLELIKPLVSRLRLSLFESRDKVIYLKNLFQYFNAINRILNREKSVLHNPSAKIESKANFTDKSKTSVNKVYERVYELLLNELFPAEKDAADVWDVFCIGEEVIKEIGKLTEEKKSKFFTELTKEINKENSSVGISFDEGFGNGKSTDDADDDITDFIDEEDFN